MGGLAERMVDESVKALVHHDPALARKVIADDVLLDEGHFHIELGELRLAISTQVLVAKTAGNLEITLHARHHQQLLHLLRRLGQQLDRVGCVGRASPHVSAARCRQQLRA